MKTTLNILATFALFIGAFHLTSCGSLFTRADAIHIGGGLALASLNLAARVVDGEGLDWKVEAAKLGLDVATQATSAVVVNASKTVAKETIQTAQTESPAVTTLAQRIADQAGEVAIKTVQGPTP